MKKKSLEDHDRFIHFGEYLFLSRHFSEWKPFERTGCHNVYYTGGGQINY